jgi:hypothetical protein
MEKQEMIEKLAQICYRPKLEDDEDYAVQLFIETLVLPKSKKGPYTLLEMRKYVEEFINDMELQAKTKQSGVNIPPE